LFLHRLFGALREKKRLLFSFVRIQLLKLQGAKIGKHVRLYGSIYIDGATRNLSIGKDSIINHNVYINCRDKIQIGKKCNISSNVQLLTTGLSLDQKRSGEHESQPILIEDSVWVGSNAVLLKGVKIVTGVVIGASSVVNKSIEIRGVYVGAPAKIVKIK
jgi:putative colanic acid biosynthesis acetyltransferase WcaF